MAKVVLAIAAAFLVAMTAIASAQDSYKSRGYGGPLNVGPNFEAGGQYTPPSYGPKSSSEKRYQKKRAYRAAKERKARPAKTVDTAKAAPVDKEAESENSSISSLGVDADKTSVPKKTETANGPQNENSSVSRASPDTDAEQDTAESSEVAKEDDESKRAGNVGCKKYFPAAGVTLSVPCD
jgi:hypothetical protein